VAERPGSGATFQGEALERALAGVRDLVAYPVTPDLATAVRSSLEHVQRPRLTVLPGALRPVIRPAWHRVVAAAAAAILMFSGVLALSPTTRRAVANFLGIGAVKITLQAPPSSPPVRQLGDGLDLGIVVGLGQARSTVQWPISVPSDPQLGQPDSVYVSQAVPGGQVSLVYRSRPDIPPADATGVGILVVELNGRVQRPYVEKALGPESTIESVTVDGDRGFWIAGQPHDIFYLDQDGEPIPSTVRLAANVLIWQHGDVTIRIESILTKAQALRIARTFP
jgi:hypothetical protein